MRALVLSDIHGNLTTLRWLLEEVWKQVGPIDAYFCLGDGLRDFDHAEAFIRDRDERALFIGVKGNNDLGVNASDHAVIEFGGAKLYLTHGHLLRVKSNLQGLREAARSAGCDIALYGHTHIPDVEMNIPLLVNPGAVCDDRCALLEVEKGKPRVRLINLGFR